MTKEQQLRGLLDREQARNRDLARASREEIAALKRETRDLRRALEPLQAQEAERRLRAEELAGAQTGGTDLARWNVTRSPPRSSPGIPTLVLSDLHVNQTIDPNQVLGVNAFGPDRAAARLKTCFETAVDLGQNHMVRPSHDGIVVPVLGDLLDLLGGYFHASERQARPVGIDAAALVADLLQPGFELLAEAFGGVRSYWVTGNHGRLTPQMPFEDRNAKNLDAAVFHILEGRLRGDKRITMELAMGPRMIYSVCGHRFLILHGDPASGMPKGGDSESGAVNVVARGVKRLRSLHLQISRPFDTAIMGHWHTRIVIPGAIVNGCLPGFGEYGSGRAFPYEVPQQTLFYTHAKHGPTCHWPIFVAKEKRVAA